jgi:hypothetical protein
MTKILAVMVMLLLLGGGAHDFRERCAMGISRTNPC